MNRFMHLLLLLGFVTANLEISFPDDLKSQFNSEGDVGSITYTVSTFGNIPYTEKEYIELYLPSTDNLFGCNNLEKPKNAGNHGKYAWLVQRSECTYSKKAFIAQQSGAYVSIVYHNQPNVDVTEIIPCADSICKLNR